VVARKSTVTIEANATDDVGMAHVEIFINGRLLCVEGTSPYRCAWKVPAAKKSYDISARAIDTTGHVSLTATIQVQAR
jgi:hypothetical protein